MTSVEPFYGMDAERSEYRSLSKPPYTATLYTIFDLGHGMKSEQYGSAVCMVYNASKLYTPPLLDAEHTKQLYTEHCCNQSDCTTVYVSKYSSMSCLALKQSYRKSNCCYDAKCSFHILPDPCPAPDASPPPPRPPPPPALPKNCVDMDLSNTGTWFSDPFWGGIYGPACTNYIAAYQFWINADACKTTLNDHIKGWGGLNNPLTFIPPKGLKPSSSFTEMCCASCG